MQRRWSFRSSDGWWRCLCWGTLWRCLSLCTHDEWSQLTGVCLGCIWREEWEHLHGPGSSSTVTCSRCRHRGTFWTGPWLSWIGDKESLSVRSCIHDLVICNTGHGKFLLKHAAHTRLAKPSRWTMQVADHTCVQNQPRWLPGASFKAPKAAEWNQDCCIVSLRTQWFSTWEPGPK